MAQHSEIPPESFDEILAWLNPDRDKAGTIYVELCNDLTRIFTWNRCADPEGLTDEVMNRVARKVHELRQTYEGDPKLFFYAVARNLIKENLKKVKKYVSLDDIDVATQALSEQTEETASMREDCLHVCLQELSADKRDLILDYYAKEKQAKIDHRTEIAGKYGTSIETLRVRAYRIRSSLEKCIERCLNRKTNNE